VNKKTEGYLWLSLTILFFSTYEIVGHTLAAGMHPLFLCAFRFTLGGLVLLPFAKFPRQGKDWLGLFILGILNVAIAMGLLQLSLSYTQASVAAILFSTNPLFVGIIAAFSGEKLSSKEIVGLVIGFLGVLLITVPALENWLGPVLALASAAVFGLYSYLGRSYAQRLGSATANSISFILGGGVVFLLLPLFGAPMWQITTENLLPMLYLGIFVTGVAYYAYLRGLSLLPPAAGSATFFAKPALATILAWIILGEPMNWWKWVGIAIIVIGMMQTMNGKKQDSQQSPSV
jgi:drug/metabolite transporter (DMT)-like permease